MKILLSAFEPFAERTENVSQMLLNHFKSQNLIDAVVLPVSYKDAPICLFEKIEQMKPKVVIALGESAQSKEMNIELAALNISHAEIADNQGVVLQNERIDEEQDMALLSDWNPGPINRFILESDYPIKISYQAGTYVCNHLYFKLLSHSKSTNYSAGFIHCPADLNRLSLEKQVFALNAFIQFIKETPDVYSRN